MSTESVIFTRAASAALAQVDTMPGVTFVALELTDDKGVDVTFGFAAEQAVSIAAGLMTLALELDPDLRATIEAIVGTGSGVVKVRGGIEL